MRFPKCIGDRGRQCDGIRSIERPPREAGVEILAVEPLDREVGLTIRHSVRHVPHDAGGS